MRDKLADICDEEIQSDYPSCYTLADAIIAALPDMVQPLEWDGFVSGPYEIEVKEGGIAQLRYWGNLPEYGEAEYLRGGYLTLISVDELKVIANTHHTRRTLSAFGITGET